MEQKCWQDFYVAYGYDIDAARLAFKRYLKDCYISQPDNAASYTDLIGDVKHVKRKTYYHDYWHKRIKRELEHDKPLSWNVVEIEERIPTLASTHAAKEDFDILSLLDEEDQKRFEDYTKRA